MDQGESDQSDEAVARSVQQGNIDAFGILVDRYEAKLKRYGRKFLARPEDIEDIVQDVFIKSYEHIQSFNTTMRFSPWIYRIAHNTFVNELKRKSKYGLSVLDPDVILPLISAEETADSDTLDAELRGEVSMLVDSLPAKYREVVVLHNLEGLSYQEISDILQISITTVGVRMTRARTKLKALYKERHQEKHL